MFAAPLLLCLLPMRGGENLVARDLAPFATVDAAARSAQGRTVAAVAKALATAASTPLARARAAYVWTTANVAYSLDARGDAAAAIAALSGDCDAHAAVFAALCKAMGVECATVGGALRFAVQPSAALAAYAKPLAKGQWLVAHSWNAVRIDGRWGLVDATMGSKAPKAGADDYFLPEPSIMATDHVPDDAAMRLAEAPANLALTPILRPLAWRMGLDAADLSAQPRADDAQLVFQPRLAWRKGMRAALQTDAGSVPDRTLVQPAAGGTEIRMAPPRAAAIVWLGVGSGDAWQAIVGYPVSGASDRRLPKVMKGFYDTGASLVGPFDRDLAAGRPAEIRLRAPGASGVVAFRGPDVAGTFVREGDTWVLRASPALGASLEVMASYEDPNRFQALLTYDVR